MTLLGKWFGFSSDEVFDEAMAEFDRGAYDEAIEAFRVCLEDDSVDAATMRLARFYAAESHCQMGKERLRAGAALSALRHFESALRYFPKYPEFNLNAARACRLLGARSRARCYLELALQNNARFPEAVILDGALLYEDGQCDEGLKRCEQAFQVDPSLGYERFQRALRAHHDGDQDRCAKELGDIASNVYGDATLHVRVAESFARDGLLEEAVREYEKAAHMATGYAEVRCKLARVLIALGRPSEALAWIREALGINPSLADAYAQAGMAYRLLGRGLEAIAAFQKAQEIDPDHPLANQELRRVRGYAS